MDAFERKPFYTPTEVAWIVSMSSHRVMDLIHAGTLWAVRIFAANLPHPCSLAAVVGAPLYLVHLSAAEPIEAVRSHRARWTVPLYAETMTHLLALTEDDLARQVLFADGEIRAAPGRARFLARGPHVPVEVTA